MLKVFADRDYRLLWFGQTIALLGDQFHLIAMPWLVLQLTRDPLQLGFVLAVAGVTRTVSMLYGGALADRRSPRDIMIWTNAARGAIAAALAAAVLSGGVEMWMVYAAAAGFGVITGLFEPASQAAVPRLVPDEQLESGNSMVMLGDQLANFLGPTAAGVLIGALSASSGSLTGVGIAFVVHATTFLVSIVLLALMGRMTVAAPEEQAHPLHAIGEGLRYVLGRRELVWMLSIIAIANFLLIGPLLVGVPVLADTRLPEGAAALGLVLSGYAAGSLVGLVLAGTLKRPSPAVLGALVLGLFVVFAAGLAWFAFVTSTWAAVPVMAAMGVGNGFLSVIIVTYFQRTTPAALLGRMMSLFMVAMFAVMPLSQALSGVLVRVSVEALFLGAAGGMLVACAVAATRPEIRRLGEPRPASTTMHCLEPQRVPEG